MSTASGTEEVVPNRRAWLIVAVVVAFCVDVLALVLALVGAYSAVPFIDLLTVPATLFLAGWGFTWLARRRAGRLLAAGPAKPRLLADRRLWAVRASWLVLFAATAVVYAFAIPVVWREAHDDVYFSRPYDELVAAGSFGLTPEEREIFGGLGNVPAWYPWLVAVRETLVFMCALAIAWSVFARRPRHWMAYFVAGLIALGPLGALDAVRSPVSGASGAWNVSPADGGEQLLSVVAWLLTVALVVGTMGLLWLFPDGRFRGTFLRYVIAVLAAFAAVELLVRLVDWGSDGLQWSVAVIAAIVLIAGGVATQVWRYGHVPLSSRRLTRWNLAILVAIPAWVLWYPALYFQFERGTNVAVFVWHQVHLTIFLTVPVLLGLWMLYLMRSQGWWDAQRFWQRTTLLVILAPLFLAGYLAVLVAVTVVAEAISGDQSRTLAVLVATAAVAFAFRPVQRAVARWVDGRFFPSRRIADETVARFADSVRQEADPVIVRAELLAAVHEAFDPQEASVWVAGEKVR